MTDLPKIGKPATQALKQIGIFTLEDLRKIDLASLKKLHGVGPKAIGLLEEAMQKNKQHFADPIDLPVNVPFALLGDLSCDNAPKRRQVRDFIIGRTMQHRELMVKDLHEAVEFITLGEGSQTVDQLLAGDTYADKKIASLTIQSVLSHGKEAAALSIITFIEGEQWFQSDFIEFSNQSKKGLIKKVISINK